MHFAQARPAQTAIKSIASEDSSPASDALSFGPASGQPGRASEVQWLIVPRHPQRFEAVAALPAALTTLWLGDSLGEMALYYSLADVALLGGSFTPLGGQNLTQ